MKGKLLVIDDHWSRGRKDTYMSVLGNDFDLFNVSDGSTISEDIAKYDVDGYLVDIVLSGWKDDITGHVVQLMSVLQQINSNKPIVLVSNEYEKPGVTH